MEAEKMMTMMNSNMVIDQEDDDVPLPGFRFHPTDEELVGFYLRRKIEKRRISIELIKQIDIYKYDPWDLPRGSNVGEKEWYFFCKRGRKYRNSVRPNRVTGSGFWKATGIDRPIYSAGGNGRDCIGLKKSLVYYRGSAGKGTKTDWMMHEFRLPADHDTMISKHFATKTVITQEAEVWTLCRIFMRSNNNRKSCIPDWREADAKRNSVDLIDASSKTCSSSVEYDSNQNNYSYVRFDNHHHQYQTAADVAGQVIQQQNRIMEKKPFASGNNYPNLSAASGNHQQQFLASQFNCAQYRQQDPRDNSNTRTTAPSGFINPEVNHELLLKQGEYCWEDLKSVADHFVDPYFI